MGLRADELDEAVYQASSICVQLRIGLSNNRQKRPFIHASSLEVGEAAGVLDPFCDV